MATMAIAPFSGCSRSHAARQCQKPCRMMKTVSCAQRMVQRTTPPCHLAQFTTASAAHHPAAVSRHNAPWPTQSYESSLSYVPVLEQFGLWGVPDFPKLVSALTLVSCSTLRPPATALLGLALLEEATQLPYDLISLE
jgi:hypothetical protein